MVSAPISLPSTFCLDVSTPSDRLVHADKELTIKELGSCGLGFGGVDLFDAQV